ncbi:MAG: transcriptional regulator, partial [Tepidisphaeraceae bacterium]
KRLDVSDGALGIHMLKLEEAKYVQAKKSFIGRRPRTRYQITAAGRRALTQYLQSMRQLLDEVERRQPPGAVKTT